MTNPYAIEITGPGGVVIHGAAVFLDPGNQPSGAGLSMLGSLYLVPAGETIALTYVIAPTWDWFGL